VRVHEAPPPSKDDVAEVARRVRDRTLGWLRRRGYLDERVAEERGNEPPEGPYPRATLRGRRRSSVSRSPSATPLPPGMTSACCFRRGTLRQHVAGLLGVSRSRAKLLLGRRRALSATVARNPKRFQYFAKIMKSTP
jgi:hypothetical protein